MTTRPQQHKLGSLVAASLVIALGLSPLANIAHAAAVNANLADKPLQAINPVKPNIMYTLDNSGSMLWGSITGFDGTGEYTGGPSTSLGYYSGDYNGVYYNPAITYSPAVDYLNNPLQNILTLPLLTADLKGNSNPILARLDPYPTVGGTANTLDVTATCFGQTPPTLPFYSRTGTYATGYTANTTNCKLLSSGAYTKLYARYAFYYVWDGVTSLNTATPPNSAFPTRVDIINPLIGGASYAAYAGAARANRTDCAAAPTCTYAEEIQNFANWFTYYRTRIQMTKSALGIAFAQLDGDPTVAPQFRVGFNTINNSGTNNSDVADSAYWWTIREFASYTTASPPATAAGASTASQKGQWFTKLYNIMPGNSTPLRTQMDRIGKLYSQNGLGGFDYTNNDPYYLSNYLGLPPDKTLVSCRPSFHVMSTDGFWNDSFSGVTNQDVTVPTLPSPVAGLTTGSNWPRPYYDANTATVPTLADVAMKYWVTDLRPTLTNNVTPSSADPAVWQHMTTFTIGLGANGNLIYQSNYETAAAGDFAAIKAGTKSWPSPTSDQQTTIDDLWHAAVNGHGTYLSAKDPANLTNGLVKILQDITNRVASASGASVSNPNITAANNTFYSVGYDTSDWSGNIKAFTIDPVSGTVSGASWQANAQIDTQTAGMGWNLNRRIVTKNPSGAGGVPFRAGSLTAPILATFGATAAAQLSVINYLRGDKTNEGTTAGKYRVRTHLLGDIVGSEAVVVGLPNAPYFDATNPGYSNFKAVMASVSRPTTLYVAANDGMVHAIKTVTDAQGPAGSEAWAYVPGIVLDPTRTTSQPTSAPLLALTYRPGTVAPIFTHHYYVDGTPVFADVDFATTGGATCATATCDWHTILVGGLNKGGRGVYALDITDPTAATEAAAAAKVLWEFSDGNSGDMGFSFGNPLIVKTKLYGWVVLVTSGYNNTSGRGVLYVLNAKTGAKLFQFNLPTGTNNGLAKINGYGLDATDFTIYQAYGGDLDGNVWRFDMDPSLATWSGPGNPSNFAQLRDRNNNVQPVTTRPEIAIDPRNNTDRWVFVGTGKYLDTTDSTTPAGYNDSMYAIKDGTRTKTEPTANGLALPVSRAQLVSQTGIPALTIPPVSSGKDGWLIDFAAGSGDKVNVDPVAFGGVISWSTNTPSADPCSLGLTSNSYNRDYATASSYTMDASGNPIAFYHLDAGVTKIQVIKLADKTRIIVGTDNSISNSGTGGTSLGSSSALGTQECIACTSHPGNAIRTNWREILQ